MSAPRPRPEHRRLPSRRSGREQAAFDEYIQEGSWLYLKKHNRAAYELLRNVPCAFSAALGGLAPPARSEVGANGTRREGSKKWHK